MYGCACFFVNTFVYWPNRKQLQAEKVGVSRVEKNINKYSYILTYVHMYI